MSEQVNENSMLSVKRGKTLQVLAILSWIWIGISAVTLLMSVASGPLNFEELEEVKVVFLSTMTPEMIEILGKEYLEESLRQMEIANEMFYSINGLALANVVLGFYAVMLMYNLKKRGFYTYIVYSLIPVFAPFIFFGGGVNVIFEAVWFGFIGTLFCILYGYQLKRMS